MKTITFKSNSYEVINSEDTADKYPNIYKFGTAAILTLKKGKTIFVANMNKYGNITSLKKAYVW